VTYILLSSHNLIANIGSVVLNTSCGKREKITSDYNAVNLSSKKKLTVNWEMLDFMEFEIFFL